MRDPFAWSFPLGRMFGVTVRVHWLFPVVAAGLILRAAFQKDVIPGSWIDVTVLMVLLFVTVLLHEYGHCFGARFVDGDANEVLLWPLGGLASVEVPHTARANFITAAAGPLMNLFLCFGSGLILLIVTEFTVRPTWNPLWFAGRQYVDGVVHLVKLVRWDGTEVGDDTLGVVFLARFFWVNWMLFLLNVVLIGFPLDGGRMFQCALWPRFGYRQATLAAVYAGFVVMFILILVAIIANEFLPFALALFIFISCKQQWIILETGGEDSMFGYDFSQGYTSLEREQQQVTPRRRQSWWQRWQQRRTTRRMQREQEQREAEEQRMDELLEKVQHHGLSALTEEERRFLKRVSDKYRNRP